MKSKKLLLFLIGLSTLCSVSVSAQTPGGPGSQGDGFPHLIPAWQSYLVDYDEDTTDFTILFRRNLPQATLFIYKDGVLMDEDVMTDIQAGSTSTYNLSFYGYGLFTIYIKIGERTYAVFEEEIEEE